jgi:hypothetical protein
MVRWEALVMVLVLGGRVRGFEMHRMRIEFSRDSGETMRSEKGERGAAPGRPPC